MQTQLQLRTESVGSSNPENNDSSRDNDYSHCYDQFNVKPKAILARRFESSGDGLKSDPVLKSPDLDWVP